MVVLDIGYNYRHTADFVVDRPKGLGVLDAVIITSRAFVFLNGKMTDVEPESVIIFNKGTPQLYGGTTETFTNDWFHFTAEDMGFFENLNIPFDTIIRGFPTKKLSDIIMQMASERNLGDVHFAEINSLLCEVFFYTLSRLMTSDRQTKVAHGLIDVRNFIFNTPSRDWSIDELAEMTGYSRSYFQHKYKEAFFSSPQQDVIESKMSYAKFLLENTQYQVNEIAALCGYSENVHFLRTFKKKTGLTPLQYRKKFT